MKWLKKWSYLLLLAGMGILYLSRVDKWQVYARPMEEARVWFDSLRQQGALLAFVGGQTATGGVATDSGGSSTEGDVSSVPPEDSTDETDDTMNESERNTDNQAGSETGQGDSPSALPETDADQSGAQGGGPGGSGGNGDSGADPGTASGEEGGGSQAGDGGGPSEGEAAGEGIPPESGEPAEPTYMTVEDDYFGDAVFIGDSRTVGLFEYAGLEETAAFYASTGLTVYKMFDSEIVSVPGERKKITVEEALQQNTFAKIYLMIGINEMGTGTVESFLEAYREAVAHLQELQPDAVIYLQAIIKVTTERSDQGDYINNEGIAARNEGIAQMADNEKLFFLDVNPLICDDTGGMVPEYTFDGVHLKAKYIDIWKDFLKTHAIALP